MVSRVKLKFPRSKEQKKPLTRYPVYRAKGDQKLIFPYGDGNDFVIFQDGSFGVHPSHYYIRGPEVKLNIEAEEV